MTIPAAALSTVPRTPSEFADAFLTLIAKGLETHADLPQIRKDAEVLVASYKGREVSVVLKAVPSRRMVYGWASVVTKDGIPVEDLQGDVMEMDNLREVVHKFMASPRIGNVNHDGPQIGEIVDSFIWDAEVAKAFGVQFGCEGWMVGYKVHDEAVWKRVEAGELPMFSIEGDGVRTPIGSE